MPAALAVLGAATHHQVRTIAFAVIAAAAGVAIIAGVDVARIVTRYSVRVVDALVAALLGVVYVVTFLPLWATRRVIHPRRAIAWPGSGTWHQAAGHADSDGAGSLAAASGRAVITRPTRVLRLVGLVMVVLAVDFGSGWTWDRLHAEPVAPVAGASGDPSPVTSALPRDPRNDVPAMAAYPWREEYFDEIQRPTGGYWPFTETRPNNFRSKYVNIDGWVRRSYLPKGERSALPVVWFFGGSTTWGEGQRDEYTVASWVSRLAERDGVPIVVRNYGQRGWTHFQEMVLFEQQLAELPHPAGAVFYDGANEITSQSLLNEAVPTHTQAYAYAQRLYGMSIATRFAQRADDSAPASSLWSAYLDHSLVRKVLRHIAPDAGASSDPSPNDIDPGPAFTGGQKQAPNGLTFDYKITRQDGIDAGHVYERGKLLTLTLAKKHHVEPFLFWQPVRYLGEAQQVAASEVTPPTIDISHILTDHDDVFIDGGHTNEEGARLVAERIWQTLKPRMTAWYGSHGLTPGEPAPTTTVTSTTTTTTPKLDLNLSAADLGSGWGVSAGSTTQLISACLDPATARAAIPDRAGPAFAHSSPAGANAILEIGFRDYPTATDAASTMATTGQPSFGACLDAHARDELGAQSAVQWEAPAPKILSTGDGASQWNGTTSISGYPAVHVSFTVMRRDARLVVVSSVGDPTLDWRATVKTSLDRIASSPR
ncbi:MAG: hypothetical protein U0Q22_02510 [Acidimicrobiales bacterium]